MGNGPQSPFIANEDAWDGFVAKCTNCFPIQMDAALPCLPQCVFTKDGKGAPPIVKYIFKDKEPPPPDEAPWFIVAYGPSGSGKSSILARLNEFSLNIPLPRFHERNVIPVNVDEMFQKSEGFQSEMKELQDAHGIEPSRRALFRQRLYQYYRWVADQIADGVLNQALVHRFHVLWETTGESTDWTRQELARLKCAEYRTLLVFPLVSERELMDRVTQRQKTTGQVAPTADILKSQVQRAQRNLIGLLMKQRCPEEVIQGINCKLAQCHPDRVIIYDNEKTKLLLYDSEDPENVDNRERFNDLLQDIAANQQFIQFFAPVKQEQQEQQEQQQQQQQQQGPRQRRQKKP